MPASENYLIVLYPHPERYGRHAVPQTAPRRWPAARWIALRWPPAACYHSIQDQDEDEKSQTRPKGPLHIDPYDSGQQSKHAPRRSGLASGRSRLCWCRRTQQAGRRGLRRSRPDRKRPLSSRRLRFPGHHSLGTEVLRHPQRRAATGNRMPEHRPAWRPVERLFHPSRSYSTLQFDSVQHAQASLACEKNGEISPRTS